MDIDNEAKAEALYQKIKAATSYSQGAYLQGTLLEYEKVLQLNPKHVGALWEAARYYDGDYDFPGRDSYWENFNQANSEKALQYFRKIIELAPKFGLAYKRLAKHCGQDKGKTLQYNLEYIHCFPQDYAMLEKIGRQYHSLNKKQEAIASFTKCLQQNQKDQRALCGLAAVYKDQGNFKEALQCLHKCIEINDKRAEAHAELGHVYDKMGNTKEAINSYRRCNQIDYNHKQANAYLKKHISKH